MARAEGRTGVATPKALSRPTNASSSWLVRLTAAARWRLRLWSWRQRAAAENKNPDHLCVGAQNEELRAAIRALPGIPL
jgi:hypothetical protein